MARPDCDDGFYKIAYELLAALLPFGFGEVEGFIVTLVLEPQYGMAKRAAAQLSPSAIERETGIPRQNIHRAIRKLTEAGVIIDLGDSLYTFSKDHEAWTKPNESPAKKALRTSFARRAPLRVKAIKPLHKSPNPPSRGGEPVIFKDYKEASEDSDVSSSKITNCNLQRLQNVISKDYKTGSPLCTPLEDRESENGEGEGESSRTRGPASSSPGMGTPPSSPGPVTPPTPTAPGSFAELEAWVSTAFRDPTVFEGSKLSNLAAGYPVEWVFEAIRCGLLKADSNEPSVPQYANGCLRRWRSRGSIDPQDVVSSPIRPAGGRSGPATGNLPPTVAEARRAAQWASFDELERLEKGGLA